MSMNAQMEKAEATMAMTAMAMPALRRLALELWHKIGWCGCSPDFGPFDPCEIGLENIEKWKRARQFAEWDALGLGYIGPILRQGVQS